MLNNPTIIGIRNKMINPLVFDIETTISENIHGPDAKDPTNDLHTVIYGRTPTSIIVEHNEKGFKRQIPTLMLDMLKDTTYLVGHNLGFDLSYVWKNKGVREFILRGGKIWDCQVAEYILTAQQHIYASLGELQSKYLGQKHKIDRISRLYKKGVGADRIIKARQRCPRVWELYEKYCNLDGATTLEIFKRQYKQAKEEGMLDIISLYQDYLLSLINISNTGIHLDLVLCEKTFTEFNLKHVEYLEQAQKLIKPIWSNPRLPAFNINSNDHKSALLFGGGVRNIIRMKVGKYKNGNDKYANVEHKVYIDGFGVPLRLTEKSKKEGVYKVNDYIMANIYNTTKNKNLRRYYELQKDASMFVKAANTYVKAFLELSIDGKLYPNFNNVAVVTGRLSSSKPNLQNISKRNKFAKPLHRLLIPPPGWKCVQVDFGQLEIWVSAFLSNDPQLIDDLQKGLDMHCVRVAAMQDCTYEYAVKMCKEVQDKMWVGYRTAAKTFSYQRAYGAGLKKVAEFTGLSEELLKKMVAQEEIRYPLATNFWRSVSDSVEKTKTFSKAINIPSSIKNTKNMYNDYMLLPIYTPQGNIIYDKKITQKVGYWRSVTGKKYHFPEVGNTIRCAVRRSISPTIMKNYPMQGTAADIQGATTAALLPILLKHSDKIQMINEVHDSKWFYIKDEYLDLIIPKICSIITNIPKIFKERFNIDVGFMFPVDVEIGENFAEMESRKW